MEVVVFYTYMWLREDGTPYYIGKGRGCRAYSPHRKDGRLRPPADNQRIIIQECLSEKDAFAAERFLIAYYGREDLRTGCLLNLTAGGEGTSGWIPTESFIEKIRAQMQGRVLTAAHKQRISLAHKGRAKSHEAVEASRKARTGTKQLPDHAARSRTAFLGGHHTEEAKEKIRRALLNRKFSEETIERMRLASLLRKQPPPLTDEQRKRLSAAVRDSWARRKAVQSCV